MPYKYNNNIWVQVYTGSRHIILYCFPCFTIIWRVPILYALISANLRWSLSTCPFQEKCIHTTHDITKLHISRKSLPPYSRVYTIHQIRDVYREIGRNNFSHAPAYELHSLIYIRVPTGDVINIILYNICCRSYNIIIYKMS